MKKHHDVVNKDIPINLTTGVTSSSRDGHMLRIICVERRTIAYIIVPGRYCPHW